MRSFEQQQKSNNASSLTIHPQLEVGGKDDPQEKEANAMADKVMRMSDGDTVRPKMGDDEEGKVRKMGDEEEGKVMKMGDDEEKKVMKMGDDEEKKVMKMGDEEDGKVMKMDAGGGGGMAAPANVGSGIQNTKGGGQNLPQNVQQDLGGKMGADFSDVKVHTDDHANEMSESINAKAFTHGKDIYFKQGNYSPESGDGKKLLAHELTHTMQSGGAVRRWGGWGMIWESEEDITLPVDDKVKSIKVVKNGKIVVQDNQNPSPTTTDEYPIYLQGDGKQTKYTIYYETEKTGKQQFSMTTTGDFITVVRIVGKRSEKSKIAEKTREDIKKENVPTTRGGIDESYQNYINRLSRLSLQVNQQAMAWSAENALIGGAYESAYKTHSDLVKSKNEHVETVEEGMKFCVELIVPACFKFADEFAELGKEINLPDVSLKTKVNYPEIFKGTVESLVSSATKTVYGSIGDPKEPAGDSPLSVYLKRVFQTNYQYSEMLKTINFMLLAVETVKTKMDGDFDAKKGGAAAIKNYWNKLVELRVEYESDIVRIEKLMTKYAGALGHTDPSEFALEFEKQLWSLWLPRLHTKRLPMAKEAYKEVDYYDTWFSWDLKARLKEITGVSIWYIWTFDSDVIALINWAGSYKPKVIMPLPS